VSGFGGIVRMAGTHPADEEIRKEIERVAERLPLYNSEQPQVWSREGGSFCFTLLKTGPAPQEATQPVTVDGKTRLIGDVRLDGRDELVSRLKSRGEECSTASTDEELVLRAWNRWGQSGFIDEFYRLLEGDYSFALWQPLERRLTCFRDLMGSRSFFYAHYASAQGEVFCFSNTLESLCCSSWISREFDFHYFGDYLLSGWCLDPQRTVYKEIKRLAPGHVLTLYESSLKIDRFSKLPIEEPLRYKEGEEYIEEYRTLVHQAVKDRLPKDGAVVFMSGGLDSTTVAATAAKLASSGGASGAIRACTADYKPLFDDRESDWAAIAANHIGIDLNIIHGGEHEPFEAWDSLRISLAEPVHEPYLAFLVEQYRESAKYARVALTGYGGDDVLIGNALPYLGNLLRHFRICDLVQSFGGYFLKCGKIPPMRAGIRARLRRWLRPHAASESYPVWLAQEFEKVYDLRARWEELRREPKLEHPLHPEAYASLSGPYWPNLLECDEAKRCGAPLETRCPLLDLRLLRFLLRVPPVPWCANKLLMRAAGRGCLPEEILRRPKSPLPYDPIEIQIRLGKWSPFPLPQLSQRLLDLIDKQKWIAELGKYKSASKWLVHCPLSLNLWLKSVEMPEAMQ